MLVFSILFYLNFDCFSNSSSFVYISWLFFICFKVLNIIIVKSMSDKSIYLKFLKVCSSWFFFFFLIHGALFPFVLFLTLEVYLEFFFGILFFLEFYFINSEAHLSWIHIYPDAQDKCGFFQRKFVCVCQALEALPTQDHSKVVLSFQITQVVWIQAVQTWRSHLWFPYSQG